MLDMNFVLEWVVALFDIAYVIALIHSLFAHCSLLSTSRFHSFCQCERKRFTIFKHNLIKVKLLLSICLKGNQVAYIY
jgi:hypothetical protein